jgi:hypothetical protein
MACYADDVLDLETLPSLRKERYAMGAYEKIIVFSASRTGSSLVYNVFRFLFEEEKNLSRNHSRFTRNAAVLKTHRFSDLKEMINNRVLYVVPIRDPLQASISTYRIRPKPPADIQQWCKWSVKSQAEHLEFAENLYRNNLKDREFGQDVLLIKYEDFDGNLDYLFSLIENYFSLSISEGDKDTMRMGYSRENVHSNIASLPNFREYLPISGFHGKHISLEKFTPPDEVLYWLNYYLEETKPLFSKYGY